MVGSTVQSSCDPGFVLIGEPIIRSLSSSSFPKLLFLALLSPISLALPPSSVVMLLSKLSPPRVDNVKEVRVKLGVIVAFL